MTNNNSKICFLFPGQGAQYKGMGKDMFDKSPAVRELFVKASDLTGIDVPNLLFEADEEELKKTENTQVAITAVNLASWKLLLESGLTPAMAAGFSLGEFSALVAAEVITEETVFPMVKERGIIMARVADKLSAGDNGPGMAAVMGLEPEKVQELCEASGLELYAANFNSAVQTVVAGTWEALSQGKDFFSKNGAKRWIPLKVSGPFHSPLLQEAREDFSSVVEAAVFGDPTISLISNVSGKVVENAAEAKKLCIEQVTSPVRWTTEEATVKALEASACIEAGPGKVLGGLWNKTGYDIPCYPAGTIEEISTAVSEL